MNVCVFSIVTVYHGIQGGMEIHEKIVTEELVKRGHRVTIISTRHPKGIIFDEVNGVKFYYLPDTVFGSDKKGWGPASFKKFLELHQRDPFDLVWSQQNAAYYFAKCQPSTLNRPLVSRFAGTSFGNLKSVFNQTISHRKGWMELFYEALLALYYFSWVESPLLRRSRFIIAVSKELGESIQKLYRVDPNKIRLIHHGTETDSFKPDKNAKKRICEQYNISPERKIILSLSTVSKQKGFHHALKAFRQVLKKRRDVVFMIAGEGDYLLDCKKLAQNLGVESKVVFTGFIPHEHTSLYYAGADIFIFPSIRIEGFARVLIEAMSCKKPIIATRIGGNPSVIEDNKDGLLINPGDIRALSSKILFLLNNTKEAFRLAENGREKVKKNFNLNKMMDETIQVFKEAL